MKICIIELNRFHRETLPSLVYHLNQLHICPTVYTVRNTQLNNPFLGIDKLKMKRYDTKWLCFFMDKLTKFRRFDCLILNTIEPSSCKNTINPIDVFNNIDIPILSIIHGASSMDSPDIQSFINKTNRHTMVLSQHIYDNFKSTHKLNWVFPVLPELSAKTIKNKSVKRFAVQGYFCKERRDYDALFDAVKTLARDPENIFKIRFLTNCQTAYGDEFQDRVLDHQLSDYFEFHNGPLSFKTMYEQVAECDFILPLIEPEFNEHTQTYVHERGSFAFPIAMQFGLIPVVRQELARCYDWSDSMIHYPKGHLYDGIKHALKLDVSADTAMRERISRKKSSIITHNCHTLKHGLNNIIKRKGHIE